MKKVLIVEDNALLLDDLQSSIKKIMPRLNISVAINEKQAIDFVQNQEFDMIILGDILDHPDHIGGHGRNVLACMSDEQKRKVVVNSSDDVFLAQEIRSLGINSLSSKNDIESLCIFLRFYLLQK